MKQKAIDNATTAYTKHDSQLKAFDADVGTVKQKQCKYTFNTIIFFIFLYFLFCFCFYSFLTAVTRHFIEKILYETPVYG